MEEDDNDDDFIIEQFCEILDWSEEEDARVSEDEDEQAKVYLIEDPFLAKIYKFLTKKFPLCKK